MEVKEIEKHGRDLAKASTSGESSNTLISLLDKLRDGVRASEETLRSTKIGIIVNKLKQHKDSNVARRASELVSKWRKDVKGASNGTSNSDSVSPAAHKAISTVNGNANASDKVATADKPAPSFKSIVPPEQRNSKTDKVNLQQTGNATRDNCIKLMYDGLAFLSHEPPHMILPIAIAVEAAAYTLHHPETSEPYKTKIRSLYQNLKNKSNSTLRTRVLSQEIKPEHFVRMTSEELKSPERRAEDEQMEKENTNKAMVAQEEKSISSSLTCGKCHQKKVSYTQAQTRSADEPMTTFCTCENCGHRWKFS